MTAMGPGRFRGCARGIFGLSSWEPLRKPGEPFKEIPPCCEQVGNRSTFNQSVKPDPGCRGHRDGDVMNGDIRENDTNNICRNEDKLDNGSNIMPKKNAPLLAKYSYKSNPNSPLGDEMSVSQGDKIRFLEEHSEHKEWWLAETFDKKGRGYVPAKYMMVIKVSSLPWLDNRELDAQKEMEEETKKNACRFGPSQKAVFKPYVSAYSHPEIEKIKEDKYKCDICDKKFTGPQPYKAHMASKMHRENVAYYEETQEN